MKKYVIMFVYMKLYELSLYRRKGITLTASAL